MACCYKSASSVSFDASVMAICCCVAPRVVCKASCRLCCYAVGVDSVLQFDILRSKGHNASMANFFDLVQPGAQVASCCHQHVGRTTLDGTAMFPGRPSAITTDHLAKHERHSQLKPLITELLGIYFARLPGDRVAYCMHHLFTQHTCACCNV